MTGSPAVAHPPRSRPPISLALIGLVTLLAAATGARLGVYVSGTEAARERIERLVGPGSSVDTPA